MTKKLLVLTVVALLMIGLMAGVAGASDSNYDNWKGIFGSYQNEREGFDYSDAYGHVNLNYRKGQKDYVTNIVTGGLEPGKYYQVVFMHGHPAEGTTVEFIHLGNFTADLDGNGYLNIKGFTTTDINPTMEDQFRPRFNVRLANTDGSGKSNSWVLGTYSGTLDDSSSNRGE